MRFKLLPFCLLSAALLLPASSTYAASGQCWSFNKSDPQYRVDLAATSAKATGTGNTWDLRVYRIENDGSATLAAGMSAQAKSTYIWKACASGGTNFVLREGEQVTKKKLLQLTHKGKGIVNHCYIKIASGRLTITGIGNFWVQCLLYTPSASGAATACVEPSPVE